MALFSIMLPWVYKYGKRMRLWSAGQLDTMHHDDDAKSVQSFEMNTKN